MGWMRSVSKSDLTCFIFLESKHKFVIRHKSIFKFETDFYISLSNLLTHLKSYFILKSVKNIFF